MHTEMKTLVIHPTDRTTDFLKPIYEGRGWTVINKHAKEMNRDEFIAELEAHDRIIMMGHGYPGGLFMSYIDPSVAPILREKDCVCIWCNADQFVNKYGLKGFYTGMFISEVGEANWFKIRTDQDAIDYSNNLFTSLVVEHIDKKNPQPAIKEGYVGDCPVIRFNNDRLYYNAEVEDPIDPEIGHYDYLKESEQLKSFDEQ